MKPILATSYAISHELSESSSSHSSAAAHTKISHRFNADYTAKFEIGSPDEPNAPANRVSESGLIHGGIAMVHPADVIARHNNMLRAIASFGAFKEAFPGIDAGTTRAAYDRARGERERAQAAIASGKVRST